MIFLAKSDIGRVRSSNQDCYAYRKISEQCGYALVCDGMGGHNGGNVASALAVKTIQESIDTLFDEKIYQDDVQGLLDCAIQKANDTVFGKSLRDETLRGTGTTLVLAFVLHQKVYIAHVGDSRAYLYRNHKLSRLTKDHSFVQEMMEQGQMTEEQAEKHPYKNIITRALGSGGYVDVDYMEFEALAGDYVMLCSDGFTNPVPEAAAQELLNGPFDDTVCDRLVAAANANGGPDNITVVLIGC